MSYGIGYPEWALKQELLSLIKLSNPEPKYIIDEIAKAAGHEGSMYSTIPLWTESSRAKLVASKKIHQGAQQRVYIDCCDAFNIWRI